MIEMDTWDIKAAHERLDACIEEQKARKKYLLQNDIDFMRGVAILNNHSQKCVCWGCCRVRRYDYDNEREYLYPIPSIKSDGTKTCPSFKDMNPELDKISSKNLSPRFEKLIDKNFWELT